MADRPGHVPWVRQSESEDIVLQKRGRRIMLVFWVEKVDERKEGEGKNGKNEIEYTTPD